MKEIKGYLKDESAPLMRIALYATLNTEDIPQLSFRYRVGLLSYKVETVFEVRVRTQTLCNALQRTSTILESIPSTSKAVEAESICTKLADGLPIWTSKETGTCILTAVLLKLTQVSMDENDPKSGA